MERFGIGLDPLEVSKNYLDLDRNRVNNLHSAGDFAAVAAP